MDTVQECVHTVQTYRVLSSYSCHTRVKYTYVCYRRLRPGCTVTSTLYHAIIHALIVDEQSRNCIPWIRVNNHRMYSLWIRWNEQWMYVHPGSLDQAAWVVNDTLDQAAWEANDTLDQAAWEANDTLDQAAWVANDTLDQAAWVVNDTLAQVAHMRGEWHPGSGRKSSEWSSLSSECTSWIPGSDWMSSECTPWIKWNEQWVYITDLVRREKKERWMHTLDQMAWAANVQSRSLDQVEWAVTVLPGSGWMSSVCTPWIRWNEQWMYSLDQAEWATGERTPRIRWNAHPESDGMYTLDQVECTPWIRWNVHPGSGGMHTLNHMECTPQIRWNEQGMNTLDEVEWAVNVHPGSGGINSDCAPWIRWNEQWMYTLDQVE